MNLIFLILTLVMLWLLVDLVVVALLVLLAFNLVNKGGFVHVYSVFGLQLLGVADQKLFISC